MGKVANFDEKIWRNNCKIIVKEKNLAKVRDVAVVPLGILLRVLS